MPVNLEPGFFSSLPALSFFLMPLSCLSFHPHISPSFSSLPRETGEVLRAPSPPPPSDGGVSGQTPTDKRFFVNSQLKTSFP